MRLLSKQEIRKIAEAILRKHGSLGATLTVTDKGGGTSMGKLQTTLSAPQKVQTGVGTAASGVPSFPQGESSGGTKS